MSEIQKLFKERGVLRKELKANIDLAKNQFKQKMNILNRMIDELVKVGVGKRIKHYTRK